MFPGRFTASEARLWVPSPAKLRTSYDLKAQRPQALETARALCLLTIWRETILMRRRFIGLLTVALLLSVAALGQGSKLEATGALSDPGASDALKKALDQKGTRISVGDGPYCDIWLRAALPAGKSDAQGAVYTSLGESVLVGVITFSKPTTDFRGQAVKAGTYTLRYAVHPADGNHLGISPIRDFLAMVPIAMDQNPDAQPKFEELMKMSAKVAGTNHP